MKKIFLVGKMNEVYKDINAALEKKFRVQLCSENPLVFKGMMDISLPDLVIISLVGITEPEAVVFNHLQCHYPQVPVITVGTEWEKEHFLKYYEGDQFENLTRPIENSAILSAVARKLEMSEEALAEGSIEAAAESGPGKKRVLIVDDNPTTLRAQKAMLDDRYDVTVAISGIKAMTAIGKRRPDVILLDYEMPVCDGKQTLEMIRADEDLKDIPVIFLTGVNDRAHIQAVMGLHPAGYLLKPANREKLIEKIEEI